MMDHAVRTLEIEPATAADLRPPRIVVFDSGLGGLTVLKEIMQASPDADILFAADDAVFPYGRLEEATLIDRVVTVVGALVDRHAPDLVVIACNTASTAVLAPLRARWPKIAFVGTVPAIKPAVALSKSRLISVLATPGTVAREYTRGLVQAFAADCAVTLVGAPDLAGLAEAVMRGESVDDAAIMREIAPAFVEQDRRRTDAIVLACTHFPLLLDRLDRLVPWPVTWVDPARAIARRVVQVLGERGFESAPGLTTRARMVPALFTSGRAPGQALAAFLGSRGLAWRPDAVI